MDHQLQSCTSLRPIDTVPIGERVLLYWEESKHFEDGIVYDDGDYGDGMYHVLFDDEILSSMPSHWTPLPTAPSATSKANFAGWYCCYPGQDPFLIVDEDEAARHKGYTAPVYFDPYIE